METSTSLQSTVQGSRSKRAERESAMRREEPRPDRVDLKAALLGWLTAISAIVLLTALAAAIAAAVIAPIGGVDDSAGAVQWRLWAAGIWGTAMLVANWFIGGYCGGYVAGRSSRRGGVQHGAAVWASVMLTALVAAAVALVAGQGLSVPTGAMPVLQLPGWHASTAALLSGIGAAAAALVGALLGGSGGSASARWSAAGATASEAPGPSDGRRVA